MYIVILIAALLLAAYALVQMRQRTEREADPHYGMVEVFNGETYVWITPQEGVALNDLDKEEFISDPSGNLTYPGREYKASRGVDVSAYQGDIDWQQVYDSGVRFAIVRAGGMYYGNGELYTDDNFIKNIEGAKAAGLRVGAYFFSQAITADEAKAEAAKLKQVVRVCTSAEKAPRYAPDKAGVAVYKSFAGFFVSAFGLYKQLFRYIFRHFLPALTEILRRMVTVVPRPGFERTRRLSIKLSIMVKPIPLRSSPPVVNMGDRARLISGMPTPLSRMEISTLLSSKSLRRMVMVPIEFG